MKKTYILAGLLMISAGMFTGCMLDNEEPAGIEAMRNAKADYYSAEAALKLAEAAYKDAETAQQQALTEWQNLQNIAQEYANSVTLAKSETEIAYWKNLLEEQAVTHEQTMLDNAAKVAESEGLYQQALVTLAETMATLDETTRGKISGLYTSLTTAMGAYNTALANYNNLSAELVSLIAEGEINADTYKAMLQLAYDKAVEALANNTSVIASYEAIINGFADITTTAAAQKTAIEIAVATYNADLNSLQTLVDTKADEKKVIDADQYNYKSSWFVAQSKSSATVTNAYVVNNFIKANYSSPTSGTDLSKYGVSYTTIDGANVYTLTSGNTFTFNVDALAVVTNKDSGDITIGASSTALDLFAVTSSTLNTLNTDLDTAEANALNIFNTFYGSTPLTAATASSTVDFANYKSTFTAKATTTATDLATALKVYEAIEKAYTDAVTAYGAAATKTQPLLDAVNTAGANLYGGSWTLLVTGRTDFADIVIPTYLTIAEMYTKLTYGVQVTNYDLASAWYTYYTAYAADQNMTNATAALALYEDLKALSDATATAYTAQAAQADIDNEVYDTEIAALNSKYDSQISVLVAKVATTAAPSDYAEVKEYSIRYMEKTSGTPAVGTGILEMYLLKEGDSTPSSLPTTTPEGTSGTALATLVSAYNALINEVEKSYFEDLLATAKDLTDDLQDTVDDKELALKDFENSGYADSSYASQTGDSKSELLSVAIVYKEGEIAEAAAQMAAAQADIDSYNDQITALCAIISAE